MIGRAAASEHPELVLYPHITYESVNQLAFLSYDVLFAVHLSGWSS